MFATRTSQGSNATAGAIFLMMMILASVASAMPSSSSSPEPYLFYMSQKYLPDLIDLCRRIEFRQRDFHYLSSLLRFMHERALFEMEMSRVESYADLLTYEPSYFKPEQVLDLIRPYVSPERSSILKQFMRYYLNRELGKGTKDLVYLLISYNY
jgi:hypothetical protein